MKRVVSGIERAKGGGRSRSSTTTAMTFHKVSPAVLPPIGQQLGPPRAFEVTRRKRGYLNCCAKESRVKVVKQYSARAQDGPQEMERNEATAKHFAWPSCAWLLLSFFTYPLGHPEHEHCTVL